MVSTGLRVGSCVGVRSPLTAVDEARVVRLQPRGSVHGRCVPAEGELAGREVVLDGKRRTCTDAEGRYAFEGVEAGVHGLCIADHSYRGITVVAGEVLEVPETTALPKVLVRLLAGGAPYLPEIGGIVMGSGTYFAVHEFVNDGGHFALESVVPGEHVLLTKKGHLARFEVEADHMVLDLGTADLAVQAGKETQVFLTPPDASPLVLYWAERFARKPGEDEKVRFGPLVPGRYDLGVAGAGIVKTIAVQGPGTVVGLD